jgi:hypothetical protein
VSNMKGMSRPPARLVAVALCIGVVLAGLASQAGANGLPQEIVVAAPHPERAGPAGAGSAPPGAKSESVTSPGLVYLPLVVTKYSHTGSSYRLGVGSTYGPPSTYPEFRLLKAGWYQDWQPRWVPDRPNYIEFVQTVRVHQELVCDLWSTDAWDREKCPYKEPHSYWMHPDMAELRNMARGHPGSLWLIGNEIDRRDWAITGGTLGQDEILPELYATAYHDIYQTIKTADPSAKVAIGGIIQPTPLRLEYLTRAWDSYLSKYKTQMPVDVWNVHNFILQEQLWSYGAGIPPGIDAQTGVVYASDLSHVDMTIFDDQIRAFRQWMKDRGQQNKPLIVSEYGVLYPDGLGGNDFGPAVVQDFMIKSFDYFLYTKDCDLGLISDDCRLVQRWAWFNLAGVEPEWGINNNVALFDPNTRQLTATGAKYRDYSLSHLEELARKY